MSARIEEVIAAESLSRTFAITLWATGILALVAEPLWLADIRLVLIAAFALLALTVISRLSSIVLVIAVAATLAAGVFDDGWNIATEALEFALIFTIFLPAILVIRETMAQTPETRKAMTAFGKLEEGQRFAGLAVGCHLLAVVLILGGLVATAAFVQAQRDHRLKLHLVLVALRGYALCVLWSPFTIGMGFALAFRPDVRLIEIMALGLPLTGLGMIVAIGLARGWRSILSIPRALMSFSAIGGPIFLSVAIIVVVVGFSELSTIEAVSAVMPLLCIVRLAPMGLGASRLVFGRVFASIHRMSDELILFMAAAAIGLAIQSAGVAHTLVVLLHLDSLGPFAMIALVIALGPALAVIGLHPIVAASIVTAFLAPLDASLPDLIEVHLILFVWSCGAFLSFGSLSLGAAARLFAIPVRSLVLSSNLAYIALFGVLNGCVLGLWTLIFS